MTTKLHRVDVYLNESHDGFFGLNTVFTDDGKSEVHRAHELRLVFTFWTEVEPESIPEFCFWMFNARDDEPSRLTLAYFWRGNRSLSVGDVVSVDGQTWMSCEGAGWKRRSRGELFLAAGSHL